MNRFIVGTRKSLLALAQAKGVIRRLKKLFPECQFVRKGIVTRGDRLKKWPQEQAKGLFVKEIEDALLSKKIDIAVHSMKDLPVEMPQELKIAAVPKRENWQDVLVSRNNKKLHELKRSSRVGTSSPRRKSQLLAARPDLKVVDIRGNVDTRLKKLWAKKYDAIVMAAAGLSRLGLENVISEYLDESIMLPAPSQGALGIQTRAGDARTNKMLGKLNHYSTRLEVEAEREFLKAMGGGCRVPIAALARLNKQKLSIKAAVASEDMKILVRAEISGEKTESRELALKLAEKIRKKLRTVNEK